MRLCFLAIVLPAIIVFYSSLVTAQKKNQNDPIIDALHVNSDIQSRFANTKIWSKVRNPASIPQEVTFNVILPKAAFINNFTMLVEGKLIVGDVKEKEKAKKDFEAAKAKGQTAGLVAQKPRETNSFTISVNVAANDKAEFNITYQEVLKRVHAYKHVINIAPGQVVDDLQLDVTIAETRKITTLVVPEIAPKLAEKTNKQLLKLKTSSDFDITQDDNGQGSKRSIHIDIPPNKQGGRAGLNGQMVVMYDVDRVDDAGEVLVVDGYFVHFFAPTNLDVAPKHVVFVLDDSGSMEGNKDRQMKEAMNVILSDLNSADMFNIVRFDESVSKWKADSNPATPRNIKAAKTFVNNLKPDDSTNIYSALQSGIDALKDSKEAAQRAKILIFLTDGQATSGPYQDSATIVKDLKKWNQEVGAVIHAISFGDDADFNLIRSISIQHNGIARKVYEGTDAAIQLQGFYDEVSNPLLSDLKVKFVNESTLASDLIQDRDEIYYTGSEIVTVGKVAPGIAADELQLKGQISGVGNSGRRTYDIVRPFPCSMVCPINRPQPRGKRHIIRPVDCDFCPVPEREVTLSNPASVRGYIERMWAYLTIKKLLDTANFKEKDTKKQAALKKRALDMSLKYNFVTPLTSMVVTQEVNEVDDSDEDYSWVPGSGRKSGLSSLSKSNKGQEEDVGDYEESSSYEIGGRGGGRPGSATGSGRPRPTIFYTTTRPSFLTSTYRPTTTTTTAPPEPEPELTYKTTTHDVLNGTEIDRVPVSSQEVCAEACNINRKCQFATYLPVQGTCILMKPLRTSNMKGKQKQCKKIPNQIIADSQEPVVLYCIKKERNRRRA